jgi:hypothetical protein
LAPWRPQRCVGSRSYCTMLDPMQLRLSCQLDCATQQNPARHPTLLCSAWLRDSHQRLGLKRAYEQPLTETPELVVACLPSSRCARHLASQTRCDSQVTCKFRTSL